MKNQNFEHVGISMTKEEKAELKEIARESGVTLSKFVRYALKVLKSMPRPIKIERI